MKAKKKSTKPTLKLMIAIRNSLSLKVAYGLLLATRNSTLAPRFFFMLRVKHENTRIQSDDVLSYEASDT